MKIKRCSRCEREKKVNSFNWKNKKNRIRQSACKECTRSSIRKHYESNKDYYKTKAKHVNAKRNKRNHKMALEYFREHPCVDCGETDPRCLTFDHVRGKKFKCVSRLMYQCKWETIKKEIAKCEVRCGNCHMKKTAIDFNHYTNGSIA